MDITVYLFLAAGILAPAAVFFLQRNRAGDKKKQIPETYYGAIRVTDQQGRDMLIVRKEDGGFEMVEESKVKQ